MEKSKLTEWHIEKLKAPLPKEAIKQHPTKTFLSAIKAIYVVERFNEVFGIGGWQIQNEVVEAGEKNIVVKSTFTARDFDIVVPDVFGGNDNPDRGDAYKGACTDALTKIGSYLYVGMDVYKGLNDSSHPQEKVYRQTTAPTPIEHKPGAITPNQIQDDNQKPWLSEKQFNSCMEKIKNGETGVLANARQHFRMKKDYREAMEQAEKFSAAVGAPPSVTPSEIPF